MQLADVTPTDGAEDWVLAAFAKQSEVDGGTFSLVLDADQDGQVVKLTSSEAAYQALIHFSGTSPHFPVVTRHARAQGQGTEPHHAGVVLHALMMEKLEPVPQEAWLVAGHINGMAEFKNHPMGLLSAVESMRTGKLAGEYPTSLVDAIEALAVYARSKWLFVELGQPANWGRRAAGTLVMLDLAHTRKEVAG